MGFIGWGWQEAKGMHLCSMCNNEILQNACASVFLARNVTALHFEGEHVYLPAGMQAASPGPAASH